MRNLHEDLEQHLARDATTLCNAWRVTRKDGVIFGFTDHDRVLTFDGTEFSPESGFLPSAVSSELGLNVDNSQVAGAFSADKITRKDLADGRYDGAIVEVFLLNWNDPESFIKLRSQEIGEVRHGDNGFEAELRSMAHRLDQPQGRTYSKRCSADLGDEACKVDVQNSDISTNGTVLSASNERSCIVDGLSAYEEHWFRDGVINWQTGDNAGLTMEINDHTITDGNVLLQLFSPMPHVPQTGDQFLVIAGCDKNLSTCRDKFSNTINFQGFPHMPGRDFAYGYVDDNTVHDGRAIVE